jgi:tetratricopeptide (TPR) repeat protein
MTGLPHEDADAFLDGELDEERADAFRLHLPDCEACRAQVERAFHLKAMAATARGELRERRIAWARWARRTAGIAGAVVMPAAAALLLVLNQRVDVAAWVGESPHRDLRERLTSPFADRYREHDVSLGPEESARAVPMRLVDALESKDPQGAAALFLLSHDWAQAEARFGKLPPSPEVDSDRAALALNRGDAAKALELAAAAIDRKPTLSQAMWNRALALSDLGFFGEAASAFRDVASLHEQGWSTEALQRAAEEERRQARQNQAPVAKAPDPEARELRERARAALNGGDRSLADRLLLQALQKCRQSGADPRCWN